MSEALEWTSRHPRPSVLSPQIIERQGSELATTEKMTIDYDRCACLTNTCRMAAPQVLLPSLITYVYNSRGMSCYTVSPINQSVCMDCW